jgi:large subunit ribosomal protein L21
MYAIVKTGGKQYRVEEGQSLLVERLPGDDDAKIQLEPLLYVDGSTVVDGDDLAKVRVDARVVAHERGPKLRVVKFKPKRGYRRRTGHRQELTRVEVTGIKLAAAKPRARKAAAPAGDGEDVSRAEAPKPVRSPSARTAGSRSGQAGGTRSGTRSGQGASSRASRAKAPKPDKDAAPAEEKETTDGA